MSKVIGSVTALSGRMVAVDENGNERLLALGDAIREGNLIRTSPDARIEITLDGMGDPVILEGGQNWLATLDTFAPSQAYPSDEAVASVDAIQAAILAGQDPTEVQEPTAAGAPAAGGTTGNEGADFVQLQRTAAETTPEAGYETIGLSYTVETPEGEPPFIQIPATLVLGDLTLKEGDGEATITATLDQPVTGEDLVITLDNGAVITIPVGDTSGTSTPFPVPGDDPYIDKDSHTVNVSDVSGGSYSSIDTGSGAAVTIEDTIDTVTVKLTATDETSEDGGSITYTASLVGGDNNPVTTHNDIRVTLTNGETITIGAGNSSGSIDVAVERDDVYLENDSISNSITGVTEANAGNDGAFENLVPDTSAVITSITDDSDTVTVTLTATGETSEDGGSITYTASLVDAEGNPVTTNNEITVELANGETITIGAGNSSGDVVVDVDADDVYLGNDDITNSIAGVTEANAGNDGAFENLVPDTSAVITSITDDSDTTTITLGDVEVAEGSNGATISATVSSPVTESPLEITLDNGATITIGVGETSGISTEFSVQGDDVYVDGESYTVGITETSGGNFEALDTSDTSTVNITDTQDTVTVTLTATDNTSEDGGSITYTANLVDGEDNSVTTNNDITVKLANGETITIGAGSSSGSIDVAVERDDVYLENDSVTNSIAGVTEENAGNAGAFENLVADNTEVSTVINDDKDAVTLNISGPTTVAEGDTTGEYTLTLVDESGQPVVAKSDIQVTVSYGGDATAEDYTPVDATVTIPAGESEYTFTLDTLDDAIADNGETIKLTIDTSDNGGFEDLKLGNDSVTTTITDDDVNVYTLRVSEEGLPGGNADNDDFDGDSSTQFDTTGAVTSSVVTNYTASENISLTAPASGNLTWTPGSDGKTLTGFNGTEEVIEVRAVEENGFWKLETTLKASADHGDDGNIESELSFEIGVVPASQPGTILTLVIEDDSPLAEHDEADVDQTSGQASGNLLANDAPGGDGAEITSISSNSATGTVDEQGTWTLQGQHGNLTVMADGSYEYTYSPIEGDMSEIGVSAYRMGESFLTDTGTFSESSSGTATTTSGGYYGVDSSGLNVAAPTQINASGHQSEALAFGFGGQTVTSATLSLSNLYQTENGGESARWFAFDANGNQVASGIISTNSEGMPYADSTEGVIWHNNHQATFTISDIGGFSTLVFDAVPYARDGSAPGDDSDYFVKVDSYEVSPTVTGEYEDVFTYTLTDGDGDQATATLTISGDATTGQMPPYIAPVAIDNNETVAEAETLEGNIITDDDDAGGAQSGRDWDADTPVVDLVINTIAPAGGGAQAIQVNGSTVITTAYGALTINPDGSYSYVANGGDANALAEGETAVDSFTYTLRDPNGKVSGEATLSITLNGSNDLPVDGDETLTIAEDSHYISDDGSNLLANVVDADSTDTHHVTQFSIAGDDQVYAAGESVAIDNVGTLQINSDGSYSFTPVTDYSGTVPTVTYTVSDGTATDTSTLDIRVEPVTDAPAVNVVLGEARVHSASITVDNVHSTDSGFTIEAYNMDGTVGTISTYSNSSGTVEGFGVAGATENSDGNNAEIQQNGKTGGDFRSETLVVTFSEPAANVKVAFSWLAKNEQAAYVLKDESGQVIGSGVVTGQTDRIDSEFRVSDALISSIEFTAAGRDNNGGRHDDYLINKISYTTGESYPVTVTAEPGDTDGSESILSLMVSAPEGTVLSAGTLIGTEKGVSTWSLPLEGGQGYDYSIDASGGVRVTGLTLTVPADFPSAEPTVTAAAKTGDGVSESSLYGSSVSDILYGLDGDDIIFGQEGDDTLIGGGGSDILSGGAGADTFIWQTGDAGTAGSPAADLITDFSADEGDVLNLSDLLQGESYQVDAEGKITSGSLDDLLDKFIQLDETADGNVELAINSRGDGSVDQKIVLENTSFDQLAGTSDASAADVLNTLISNNQLIVDQS